MDATSQNPFNFGNQITQVHMKIITSIVPLLVFLVQTLSAQVIRTEPVFPTESDSLRIIFDAAQGSAGLAGFTGDIWAHTGVITNKSSSGSDWKYVIAAWSANTEKAKLKSVGNNLWELKISPSIRSFYGVPSGEKILKVAFVFRNSDGSRTGRNQDGSDIFVNIYEGGLYLSITKPDKDCITTEAGAAIEIQAAAVNADSIALFHDSNRIFSVTGLSLNYTLTAAQTGYHSVEAKAYGQGKVVADGFGYLVKGLVEVADLPSDARDGINYDSGTQVTLVLYAPQKEFVFIIGDFNNWSISQPYLMKKTPDGKRYWLTIGNLEPKREYIFQYLVDGDIRIADPYTDKVSDPDNDQYITSATYPGLIPYPAGKTNQPASVLQTGQEPYIWKTAEFNPSARDKLVIYEVLLRDFLQAHTFSSLTDTLDYLKNLGINAVELMPVNEFEGNESWGYNPSFYFAIDKYYGPKNTFKAFIDSAHQRGMAVIMDMVLNHSYGQSPMVRMYWDAANNRPSANNPWYNDQCNHPPYCWGYDFNHASDDTKRFVDSVNSYWLTEYGIDGFRFDFTKGFTNTQGAGGGYDASRIAILKRMADKIWSVKPGAYIILEHFTDNAEEKVLSDYGMLIWGNSNTNYSYASQGKLGGSDANFNWISSKVRGWTNPYVVGYMESHDEERLMYGCMADGNTQNPSYRIKDLNIALKRMELCANFFIPVPGPKMIWMFGELGYDYSINYNGRIGNKPIRWDYLQDTKRKRLYQVYSSLISLKSEYPVFSTNSYTVSASDTVKRIHFYDSGMNVLIIGNFGIRQSQGIPYFQHSGRWYEYWTGDSVEITDVNGKLLLNPGEYRLYTDKRLKKPDIISGVEVIEKNEKADGQLRLVVYPNPASGVLHLDPGVESPVYWWRLLDLQGREVLSDLVEGHIPGAVKEVDLKGVIPGIYLIEVETVGRRGVGKVVVY